MKHINSRADLENLRGTADFEDVLRGLRGAFTTWSLVDGAWVAQENLSVIERFGYDKAGFLAEIAPFDFPEPSPPAQPIAVVPQSVSRRQIITGLGLLGWITEQEAIDALATGARPAAVNAVINQLPQEEQFPATMKWIGFQTAYRNDSMVLALAAVAEKSEQDVDEFFLFCSQID